MPRLKSRHKNLYRTGFTLLELLLTTLMLIILAAAAIPRVGLDAVGKVQTKTLGRQFANYLRLAKSMSIVNAAISGQGYMVELLPSSPYSSFQIVNVETSNVVKQAVLIPDGLVCTGDDEFAFTNLGDLNAADPQSVEFSMQGKTVTITVWPAAGRIEVQE